MTRPTLPPGDVLLHAGDLSINGSEVEIQEQLSWLSTQPHTYKVIIAGNHDVLFDQAFLDAYPERKYGNPDASASKLDFGSIIYLCDNSTVLEFPKHGAGRKLSIYGSPTTPQYGCSAFQVPRSKDVWSGTIPDGTDILLTHGPPLGHLDGGLRGGCVNLTGEIARTRPRLVAFGHIHVGYGKEELLLDPVRSLYEGIVGGWGGYLALLKMGLLAFWAGTIGWLFESHDNHVTTFVNAAVVGGTKYEYQNAPIVVHL